MHSPPVCPDISVHSCPHLCAWEHCGTLSKCPAPSAHMYPQAGPPFLPHTGLTYGGWRTLTGLRLRCPLFLLPLEMHRLSWLS